MVLIVRVYSDKKGRQYQIPIPKNIVNLMDIKHKDQFKLEIDGDKIILTRIKEE